MRTRFVLMTLPIEAATRLGQLLPALSKEQARDWTAVVYGYRNWCHLAARTERNGVYWEKAGGEYPHHDPVAREVGEAAETEFIQRDNLQRQRLTKLVNRTDAEALLLYETWNPLASGVPRPVLLTQWSAVSDGTPAFRLMQESLFTEEGSSEYADFDHGVVHLGYPGSAAARSVASLEFVEKLPKGVQERECEQLLQEMAPLKSGLPKPRMVTVVEDKVFAQVQMLPFFACSTAGKDDVLGFALARFELTASLDGDHSVNITVERFHTLTKSEELVSALSRAIALAVWAPVSRYLWTTHGNVDKQVTVRVQHMPDRPGKAAAKAVLTLLSGHCGWPYTYSQSERTGVHFKLLKAE